jgi:hypothetical protein
MFCLKSNFFNDWYFITSYRAYDQNSLPRFTIKGVFITSLIFCYHVIICSSENIAYMQGKKVTAILYQRQSIMPCMISFWGLYWILVLNVRRSRRSISVCQQWWAGPKMELSNICQSGLGGKFMGGKVQVYRWRGKRRWWSRCFKQYQLTPWDVLCCPIKCVASSQVDFVSLLVGSYRWAEEGALAKLG